MPVWAQWRDAVRFSDEGPGVTLLHESSQLKVVLVGLRSGQALPEHPGPAASFFFLDGQASMVVGEDEVPVTAGSVVVVPSGASRAVRAVKDAVFIGNLGDPGAEAGPA